MIADEPRRGIAIKGMKEKKLPENVTSIVIGIPTRNPQEEWGRWSPEFSLFLKHLAQPMNYNMGFEIEWGGVLPAENREIITNRVIKDGAKYLIFFDDDTLMPRDTLLQFMRGFETLPDAAIISGLCCKKSKYLEPEVFKFPNEGRYWKFKKESVEEVWVTGAGCIAINLEYVKQMKSPYWIDEIIEDENSAIKYGQDINFCRKVREETKGKVYLDTHIVCGHLDIKTGFIYWPEFIEQKDESKYNHFAILDDI